SDVCSSDLLLEARSHCVKTRVAIDDGKLALEFSCDKFGFDLDRLFSAVDVFYCIFRFLDESSADKICVVQRIQQRGHHVADHVSAAFRSGGQLNVEKVVFAGDVKEFSARCHRDNAGTLQERLV